MIILFPEGQQILVDIRVMIFNSVLSSATDKLAIFSLVFMNDFTSIWTAGLLYKTKINVLEAWSGTGNDSRT
jgi:NADH:ubiquinone oxidoreductase subunit 3 (subunit A)